MATFPPYWAGIGNVAFNNALGLARRGHSVSVFTASSKLGTYRDPPEIDVRRLPALFRFGNAPFTPHLVSALRGFDVVHLHWPYIFGAELTTLASVVSGCSYVVTYHMDLRADLRWQFGPYQSVIGPIVLRLARRVFPVSLDYFEASPMRRHVPEDRVAEIPNGVDVTKFSPEIDGRPIRDALGISPSAIVIGYVGAMDRAHASRGVPVLLDAIARLNRSDVHLVAVGGGDLRHEYIGYARRIGLSDRCSWPGPVEGTGSVLPRYFAAMDVVTLPSLRAESFGMILVEGMAAGKPVIGTTLPGVRRVVDAGTDGLLVPPGDVASLAAAIDKLASDPKMRSQLGENGRAKAEERYDWVKIAQAIEAQYLAVLSGD